MLSISSHVFSEIFLHFNWHCKQDHPFIDPVLEIDLYKYLEDYCLSSKGVYFYGAGGTATHVHLVVQVEPIVTIAEWVGKIKGASSHDFNQNRNHALHWQRGYGVVSFAGKDMPAVLRYVEHQKEHHAKGKANAVLEKCGYEEVEPDEVDIAKEAESRAKAR